MNDLGPNGFGERRSHQRTTTVYRPVLIETEEIAGFCLLRNISPGGMMGKFHTDLSINTPVKVRFNPVLEAQGQVLSSGAGQVVIQFSAPVDVPTILQEISSSTVNGKVNRAPRLQLLTNIKVALESRTITVELHDISQKGLKIRTSYLRSGDEVTVLLDGLEGKKAIVRWTQAQFAGLNFIQPMAFDQLGEWVMRQHQRTEPFSACREWSQEKEL